MPAPGDEWAAGDVPDEPLGPDDLRHLADLLEGPTKYVAQTAREGMWHCADAWEKRETYIKALEKELAGIALVSKGPQFLHCLNWWQVLRFIYEKAQAALAKASK